MDIMTKKDRSLRMSLIKSKNTRPEIKLRQHIWGKGIGGYRVNSKITGKPDLYFPSKKIAIFIDGCFWHMCPKCYREPKSNKQYWINKIKKNVERDKKINKQLKKQGITVLRIWEHEVKKDIEKCSTKIYNLLNNSKQK